jgi:hypothetical protein
VLQQPRSQEETPCTSTQEVSWETLLNKEENPTNPLLYYSRERTPPPRKPSTQKGAHKPRRLVPKRGAHFSQEDVLAEISKLTLKI